MPLNDSPVPATNIINFGGNRGAASELNYNVPLPGRVRGRRIQRLEGLAIETADWKTSARGTVIDLHKQIDFVAQGNTVNFDEQKATALFLSFARANGIRGDIVGEFERALPAGKVELRALQQGLPDLGGTPGADKLPILDPPKPMLTDSAMLQKLIMDKAYQNYILGLKEGKLRLPQAKPDGSPNPTAGNPAATADPAFYLVEVYAISSFLGNYGLGRTVKTFTLLPGEQMTIRMRTWRSSEQVRKEASTIFDSYGTDSSDRFTTEVQRETTDKATKLDQQQWHADAEVGVSWGFGSAKASGGGSGEEQTERESFVRGVNNAAMEHANKASSKRDTTISSSSETTDRTEDEETTERTIRNVNLRRTLNFVFRELNQEYLTKIHLIEFRLAYSNGTAGSWREVPVSGMRGLLEAVLERPAKAAEVASAILDQMMYVWDKDDAPVRVLDRITFNAEGNLVTPLTMPARVNGVYPAPTRDLVYRFGRGPLGTQGGLPAAITNPSPARAESFAQAVRHSQHVVDGVVLKEDMIVLRTDAVVVEALLGQADALDEYAMMSQKADAEAKVFANAREGLINAGLALVTNGEQRLKLYADLIRPASPLKIELDNKPG